MLIDKEDAKKAICEVCYMYKYIGDEYKECRYYPCDDIKALEAVPSVQVAYVCDGRACNGDCTSKECTHTKDIEHAKNFIRLGEIYMESAEAVPEAPSGDLISRADAIGAVRKLISDTLTDSADVVYNSAMRDGIDAINALPPAEGGDADMNEVKPQYMQASPSNGADLIRREDAIDVVTDIQDGSGQRYYLAVSLVDKIRSLPSAEAVQGEWKRVPTRTYKGECTNCGFRHIFMDGHDSQYRFCPNCGAKMFRKDGEA